MICDTPIWVLPKGGYKHVPVPCGRCPPCRDNRVDGWVFRLMQEDKQAINSYFITFTYDTRKVPITSNGFMSLQKKDFQHFMKRLRIYVKRELGIDPTIKYYMAGEYGSSNKRPHYHAIMFNVPDKDFIKLPRASEQDHQKFVSKKLQEIWGLGSIDIGQVSGNSIAYTCKYINKPGRIPEHKRDDRQKEFSLMSKGLGMNYLTPQVIQYHKADVQRNHLTLPGGFMKKLPRIYRDRIYDDTEKALQRQEINRIKQKEAQDEQKKLNLSDEEYSTYKEGQKITRRHRFWKNLPKRDI